MQTEARCPGTGDPHKEWVLVLDFGSQYTQLIARRIREQNVYSEIQPFFYTIEEIRARCPKGIILSGGPSSIYDEGAPTITGELLTLGIPVLGICYGMQLMADLLGGDVRSSDHKEYGPAKITVSRPSKLFDGLEPSADSLDVWMSHGDRIHALPEGFSATASSGGSPVAAFENRSRNIYGVQFHPEVIHTPRGIEILRQFVFGICAASPTWTPRSFIQSTIGEIAATVGNKGVICGLSGGVDSSVAAALIHKAVGEQLTCIFVDNGVVRHGEPEMVSRIFSRHLKMKLIMVDASDRFLAALKDVEEPEEKRKIIGNEFIRVFEEEADKLEGIRYLAQGTLYPDVIESTSTRGPSATIKSHHNVGGLPEKMDLELIEPLRELFKDEVREVGRELGLSSEIVQRQPFPGPGLAVRILGDVDFDRLDILRNADAIVQEEIMKAGLEESLWQSFAVLLPVKTVGVMGDFRTYENVVALRAVESLDGMTADWARLPYDLLGRISSRIINEVQKVNRVVYDISSKPPSTIEWE